MNAALALLVSFLPRRYWRNTHGVGILFSAFIQLGFSGALLVNTYTSFAARVSDGVAESTIDAAVPDVEHGGKVRAGVAMAFGALTPLGFLAVSNTGRVLVYLVFSAIIRLVAYACDHPCGDPLLTFVDDLLHDAKDGVARRGRSVAGVISNWRARRAVAEQDVESEDA